jgi:alkylation response protein AidB-like acyl-CoA dehydrogenase
VRKLHVAAAQPEDSEIGMTDDDTLRMLEEAARGFAEFDAGRLRALRDSEPGFNRELWQEMGSQGWFSILVSEADGGLGLGIDAATTIARQLGRACAPEPFVAAGVMAPTLLGRLSAAQNHSATFADVLSGRHIACVAWQNTTGSLDPGATEVRATEIPGMTRLSGSTRFVPIAHVDSFLVTARHGDTLGVHWIKAGTEGLIREIEPTADGGFSASLTLNNVEIPAAACLARGDAAGAAIEEAVDFGIIANCAELLGNMERALELTLDYLKTRRQFGQAIGSFQVLQHRTVDIWMKMQVTQHALKAAVRRATAPDVPRAVRARAASGIKARTAEEAHRMANETVQLHGAIGYTDEYDLSLYVNRSLTLVPFLGNATEHRRRYDNLRQAAGDSA